MRQHLLQTFDDIRIINLHGGTRDGSKVRDDNVFDITVENCIWLMIKHEDGKKRPTKYFSVKGTRQAKFDFLTQTKLENIDWTEIEAKKPYYFFFPFDDSRIPIHIDTFTIDDLFLTLSSGVQTKNDPVAVAMKEADRDRVIKDFNEWDLEALEIKYPPKKVWKTNKAADEIKAGEYELRTILYKPFDKRYSVLTKKSSGFLGRPRYDVMKHIKEGDLSLVVNKKHVGPYFSHAIVADTLVIHGTNYLGNRGQDYVCPLYLRADEDDLDQSRRVNMNDKIRTKIEDCAKDDKRGTPDELAIFDYIYGVLYSPFYRDTYAEFLKIDFPRVPYPTSANEFWSISEKGAALRKLHLMDGIDAGLKYPFKGVGDNVVSINLKNSFVLSDAEVGNVLINDGQYFENVPLIAWQLYVGGFQPAQKWLKDRKEKELSFDDIMHFRKIIHILMETDRIMKTIKMNF